MGLGMAFVLSSLFHYGLWRILVCILISETKEEYPNPYLGWHNSQGHVNRGSEAGKGPTAGFAGAFFDFTAGFPPGQMRVKVSASPISRPLLPVHSEGQP
jgi:hypothetical protein